jgi:hypothetical protein
MRPWVAVVAAAAAIAVLAPHSPAQSLGEIAAKTNKKKDATKSGKPAKVYTESDLRGPGSSGSMSQMEGAAATSTDTPATNAAPAAGEKVAKTPEEERAEKMTEWRGRLEHAQAEVVRITGDLDRAQTALNDLSVPLYGGTRSAQMTRVEEGKRQLVLAQQLVLDTQEEGRRAGFR